MAYTARSSLGREEPGLHVVLGISHGFKRGLDYRCNILLTDSVIKLCTIQNSFVSL